MPPLQLVPLLPSLPPLTLGIIQTFLILGVSVSWNFYHCCWFCSVSAAHPPVGWSSPVHQSGCGSPAGSQLFLHLWGYLNSDFGASSPYSDVPEHHSQDLVMAFHVFCLHPTPCCCVLDCLRGLFAQPAPGVLSGAVTPASTALIVLLLGPLCCLSDQSFPATDRTSCYQPHLRSVGGTCRAETYFSMVIPPLSCLDVSVFQLLVWSRKPRLLPYIRVFVFSCSELLWDWSWIPLKPRLYEYVSAPSAQCSSSNQLTVYLCLIISKPSGSHHAYDITPPGVLQVIMIYEPHPIILVQVDLNFTWCTTALPF